MPKRIKKLPEAYYQPELGRCVDIVTRAVGTTFTLRQVYLLARAGWGGVVHPDLLHIIKQDPAKAAGAIGAACKEAERIRQTAQWQLRKFVREHQNISALKGDQIVADFKAKTGFKVSVKALHKALAQEQAAQS